MSIRLGGIIAGLAIVAALMWSLLPGAYNLAFGPPAEKSAYYPFKKESAPPEGGWTFDGPFGKFDEQQLQRGYAIYKNVCSSCHGMKYVAFRNLADLGYSEDQIAQEAASYMVAGIDPNTGEATMVPAKPTDNFPSPYPNNVAAAIANNNAIPPDLSLITKARKGGPDYIYSLLTGYDETPDPELMKKTGFEVPDGLYYNPWFPNVNLAMPPQLYDGLVTYDDGTEATVDQMGQDITAFLHWAAEPKLEHRKQTGAWILGFLFIATILAFLSYKQIWAGKKPKRKKA